MTQEFVFSWAENAEGKMVHVDDVPRGLNCGCTCPNCHEKLLARHGEVNEHGFAHHSETRGANLKICYMVILYKLAEQIILTRKRIHAPSYYGIYKEIDIEFVDVRIDSQYEREDKQPDVIATTKDGKQYLIEFVFKYKAQHKQALDYKNLTCMEIDLSNQSLESLEKFLLSSSEDRKWLNSDDYFNRIEETYHKAGKAVKIVNEAECEHCNLRYNCCAVTQSYSPIVIENSGIKYRLCKTELHEQRLKALKERLEEEERARKERIEWQKEQRRLQEQCRDETRRREKISNRSDIPPKDSSTNVDSTIEGMVVVETEQKNCFNCQSNLTWANRDGWANCGCYISLGLPKQRVNPNYAKQCYRFRPKKL